MNINMKLILFSEIDTHCQLLNDLKLLCRQTNEVTCDSELKQHVDTEPHKYTLFLKCDVHVIIEFHKSAPKEENCCALW